MSKDFFWKEAVFPRLFCMIIGHAQTRGKSDKKKVRRTFSWAKVAENRNFMCKFAFQIKRL